MSTIRENAKGMRKVPTRSEARLWSWLEPEDSATTSSEGSIRSDGYILDFYCAELKLAIEVDGKQHETPWMNDYDSKRTDTLKQLGISVARIENEIFARDSRLAAEIVKYAIERAAPHPASGHPLPAPRGEG